jgi:hypothetical protein
MRHTFASLLASCDEPPAYVIEQLGHIDPKFTRRVYTHTMSRRDGERDRVWTLVSGVVEATGDPKTRAGILAQDPPGLTLLPLDRPWPLRQFPQHVGLTRE